MSLLPRIDGTDPDPTRHFSHDFGASMVLLSGGDLTRAQIETAFAMTALDKTGFTALIAAAQAFGDMTAYAQKVEACVILIQAGMMTAAKAKSILGL